MYSPSANESPDTTVSVASQQSSIATTICLNDDANATLESSHTLRGRGGRSETWHDNILLSWSELAQAVLWPGCLVCNPGRQGGGFGVNSTTQSRVFLYTLSSSRPGLSGQGSVASSRRSRPFVDEVGTSQHGVVLEVVSVGRVEVMRG
ncbi:hypothetical protein PoB_003751100 [Plakobranchus ocellatus]|uniref:Uncharacterized protein n=1 Tax=Plakobranchus ocellatus TaxID=259542 RepID=A0AAV4AIK8_9GAST|nr:hypothetical protein PoB_003751100 [Plakobranchus ocellatus]